MRFWKCATLVFLIASLASPAWAKPTLSIWSSIEAQTRQNQAAQRETPLNLFNAIHGENLPGSGMVDSYFQIGREFGPDTNQLDLFSLEYRASHITENFGGTFGRQTTVQANYEGLLDGTTLYFTPNGGPFTMDLFGGTTRSTEEGDIKHVDGLMAGSALHWRPSPRGSFTLSSYYRQDTLRNSQWKNNSTILINGAGSLFLDGDRDFQLFTDITYDTAGKILPLATAGLSWQINPKFSLTASGNRYSANRSRIRTTIFSLFTDNDMWQARGGLAFYPNPRITLFTNYDWQRFDAGAIKRIGHIIEGGLDTQITKLHMDNSLLYRYVDSFGGRAHDFLLSLLFRPWNFLEIGSMTNVTKYEKNTREKDTAIATALNVGWYPKELLCLGVGGEFLRNDSFNKEWRLNAQLTIDWDVVK